MNRTHSTFAAALLCAAGFTGGALANDQQTQHNQAGKDTGMNNAASTQKGPEGGVRDWAKIDTNNDDLIQPEEMEVALQAVGPQAKASKQ